MTVINVEHLSKTFKVKEKAKGFIGSMKTIIKPKFKEIQAVKDISFKVEEGEVIAFIGPNGAGKSTTIKMLTGILYPDSGNIEVLGIDPSKKRKKLAYEIGTVFGQKEQLWMHLTPYDNFKFFGSIYDIPEKETEKRIEELNKLFNLGKFINTPVRNLSLGQRIRCEIVASLIHRPKVLFLDEPTIAMIVGFTMGMIFLKDFPMLSIPAITIVLLSGMLAVLINSLLVTFIGLISFIIEDSNPIFWLYSKMILVLGVLFPIEYFPGVLAQIMRYSPIYVTCYGPAKLFVDFSYSSAVEILISQILYLGVAWIMCYSLYKKGVRRLNVTGG